MSPLKWLSKILRARNEKKWNVATLALLSIFLNTPALSDETADVSILLRTGQLGEALGRAEKFLAGRPHDVQMRFLKGVILTEKHEVAKAIEIFFALSEDFPDSPEPFNNLAVLLASNGQFEKARDALEAAMRTHPSYATAYKNMNNVRASLAKRAGMPQPLDGKNTLAAEKLTSIWSLEIKGSPVASTIPALAAAPLERSTPATITEQVLKTALPGNPSVQNPKTLLTGERLSDPGFIAAANQQLSKADPKPERFIKSETINPDQALMVVKGWSNALSDEHLADVRVKLEAQDNGDPSQGKVNEAGRNNFNTIAIAAAAPTLAASEAITPAAALGTAENQEFSKTTSLPEKLTAAGNEEADHDHVLNIVNGWSTAWSRHDTENYLRYYSKDFQTTNNESFTAWANKRRARVSGQGQTSIEVDSPHVVVNENTANVRFRQIYISKNFKSDIYKTLTFTRKNGEWKIIRERIDD